MGLGLVLESGDSMGELTQEEQEWKAVLNWLGLLFRVFSDIIGGAFSHYPLLLSFSSSSSSHHPFHPLPLIEQHQHQQHQALQIASDTNQDHRPLQRLTVVLDLDETLICAYER